MATDQQVVADVRMPRLSDSMEEGTVIRWLRATGDDVAVGDDLVEIETDKATMVFESDAAGTLVEICVGEGGLVPIGEVIARVGDPAGIDAARPAQRPEKAKVSPIARRIAAEHGIDLAGIRGTGPEGRIVKADVEAAVAVPDASPAEVDPPAQPVPATPPSPVPAAAPTAPGQRVALSRLQRTVARRMAESKATVPHFYLNAEVDMSRCAEARARLKATVPDGTDVPSFNDIIVKACAVALRAHPRANATFRDDEIELHAGVNVGVAVAAEHALVVPTIFDADAKGLSAIAAETRELAARVRDGAITPPELSGGTFTVSNLGMFGVTNFQPIINLGQAAILACGAIAPTVIDRGGHHVTAQMMQLTLACDHRVLYGADGAQFLAFVRTLLGEPTGLAL